jgi:hypothetical protein
MSSKKSKKGSIKLQSLPRTSLSELIAANAVNLELGRNGDERYAGFAADVDFIRESFSTLAIEGNLEMLEWTKKVGAEQVCKGLLGDQAFAKLQKLVKKLGIIEPRILQTLYRKVQVLSLIHI